MLKVAVCVSGGGTNLQAVIDGCKNGVIKNAEVAIVISSDEKAYALERARIAGIETAVISNRAYPTDSLKSEAFLKILREKNIDLTVLAGFLTKVPGEVVSAYKNRIINIHPSLIPSFCGKGCYGLKVHEAALKRGVKITGATVHFVDESLDTGPIIFQKAVAVLDDDTPESLQKRVMEEAEWIILPKVIDMIANKEVRVKDGRVFTVSE